MISYIVVTNESQKYIKNILQSLIPIEDNEELIIFDNHSKDNTVPIIIETIGIDFKEEDKYKFYINTTKQTVKQIENKALSIAKGQPIVIRKRTKFKRNEVLKDVKN